MDRQKIKQYANLLYVAEGNRAAIPPLTELDATLTVDDAYAIQLENVDRAVAQGYLISGKKIGLTSPGIQQQLGVNEPDYGHLFDGMDCTNGEVEIDRLLQPKIEAEIAFVLKADLVGGIITAQNVRDATDYVMGAFEIVDSRVANWKIKLADTVADNASSGRYVLGEKRLRLEEIAEEELSAITMKLYKNGKLSAEGTGAAVLGDPCLAVAWLANRLRDFGVILKKGEIILSGAFTAAPLAAKGDEFEAVFSSLGSVKARFV